MNRLRNPAVAAALATLFWVAAGCADLVSSGADVEQPDPCDLAADPRPVGGEWVMTGRGARHSCDNSRFNSPNFELLPLHLTVTQTDEQLDLHHGGEVGGASLEMREAWVRGSCIKFRLVEIAADGGVIDYAFEGEVLRDGRAVGSFEGQGPGDCRSSGHFSITLP